MVIVGLLAGSVDAKTGEPPKDIHELLRGSLFRGLALAPVQRFFGQTVNVSSFLAADLPQHRRAVRHLFTAISDIEAQASVALCCTRC
jgi:hypothetical protein